MILLQHGFHDFSLKDGCYLSFEEDPAPNTKNMFQVVEKWLTNCQFIRFLVNSDTPLIRLTFSLAIISSSAKATFIVL